MKLYSAWYCPFAQRSWWAAVYKNLDFELIETDPYDKTVEWLTISQGVGQVPALACSNKAAENLIDSNRIVEFLDEAFPSSETQLLPADPFQKARAKFWMDFTGRKIIPYIYQLLQSQDTGQHQQIEDKIIAGISEFTEAMSTEGPFFFGQKLSAVDMALAPFAHRIEILLSHYRQFYLPSKGAIWQRYALWLKTILDLKSFKYVSTDRANYTQELISSYEIYAQGGGQTDVAIVK